MLFFVILFIFFYIKSEETEVHTHSEDKFAPVYYLFIKKYSLVDKN
jgi:hypothetical protein